MNSNNMLVFDCETTGLTIHPDAELRKKPRCIEFGAALLSLEDGHVVDTINVLINPGVPLESIITKITGIVDADLKDQPDFKHYFAEIAEFFSRSKVMVAHNLPFDTQIIEGELARLGIENFPWPERGICTVGLYKDVWGKNPKLVELYEHVLGKPLAQTHRALDDVMALVEIIHHEEIWRL